MCGICGVFEYRQHGRVDHTMLASMLAVIRHRGPDDEGIHLDEGLGIGSRRLSIIDLPGGHQPISNEDGSVVVVFNGEIYNYRELRERAASGGHSLRSRSDTEVIVHLYEEHGDGWSTTCEECSRSRFGTRGAAGCCSPETVSASSRSTMRMRGGRLIFGSEIKAILEHPGVVARPRPRLARRLSLAQVRAVPGHDVRRHPRAATGTHLGLRSGRHPREPLLGSLASAQRQSQHPKPRPPSGWRNCCASLLGCI